MRNYGISHWNGNGHETGIAPKGEIEQLEISPKLLIRVSGDRKSNKNRA